MLLEIALMFAIGMALGVLAGLVPGLHPNTLLVIAVAVFLSSAPPNGTYGMIALVVSMSVSNAIVNFIPSIFLGAPDPDSCLSILPGHRMLMEGRGNEALFLTIVGSVGALALTAVSLPLMVVLLPVIYEAMHAYMLPLLVALTASLLLQERMKARSLLMFIASGAAGFMLLSAIPSDQALFPAFSGLFGASLMLGSLMKKASLPPQGHKAMMKCSWAKGTLAGWAAGLLVGIMPGIGSAQAGVLASRALKGDRRDFLVALGGISISNIIFTFIALHTIGKTRSGAAWALSEAVGSITMGELCFIMFIAALSCFASSIISLKVGKVFLGMAVKLDYGRMNLGVLVMITALVGLITGMTGLLVMALCSVMGLCCEAIGVKKMYLMGFLMLPTMLYFAGLSPYALLLLGL